MKYKLTILFISFSLISFIFMSSTVIASLPKGPLSFSKNTEENITNVLFQGWGFFSKDPRDPMLDAFPLESDQELIWPNNRMKNWFGIKRTGRKQGIELGAIIGEIPPDGYKKCEDNVTECIDDIKNEEVLTIENKNNNPSLCGSWGISYIEPIPWSWGKSKSNIDMPAEVAKVEIQCSKK